MTTENQAADTTATTAPAEEPKIETTAEQTAEQPETLDEQQAETDDEAAKQEEEKRQASERTRRRREQRRKAAERRETEARIKAEREAAYWRGRAESTQQPTQQAVDEKPRQEDYNTFDEWLDARDAWRDRQATKPGSEKDEVAPDRKPAAEAGAPPSAEQVDAFKGWSDKGRDKYGEDFDELMSAAANNEFATTQTMAETMFDEGNGPDIAMHLFDNPEEAARIAALSLVRQVREIQRIGKEIAEGKIATASPTVTASPQRTISQAPAPVTPERSGSAPRTPMHKLSTEDYIARRRKQMRG